MWEGGVEIVAAQDFKEGPSIEDLTGLTVGG